MEACERIATDGISEGFPQRMRATRCCGSSLVAVAVMATFAYMGLPQEQPLKFMLRHSAESESGRRLVTPAILKHPRNFSIYKNEVTDFHGFRDGTTGYRDVVCKAYNGIDHPNSKGCCPIDCGNYCGTPECFAGPGGNDHCCEGHWTTFCSPGVLAPCLLDTTKLAKVYDDSQCQKYNGIDAPGLQACCPPTCGEYCGTQECGKGPGGEYNCCPGFMRSVCGPSKDANSPEFNAPCILPATLDYPGARAHYSIGQKVTLVPFIGGGHSSKFMMPAAVPRGFHFNVNTGVIEGAIPSDFNDDAREYQVKISTVWGDATCSFRFYVKTASIVYPAARNHFPAGGQVRLVPKITGGLPTLFSVLPALPPGLKLDIRTGEITGVLKKTQKPGHWKYFLTAKNTAGVFVTEIYLLIAPAAFDFRWFMLLAMTIAMIGMAVLSLRCMAKKPPNQVSVLSSYAPLDRAELCVDTETEPLRSEPARGQSNNLAAYNNNNNVNNGARAEPTRGRLSPLQTTTSTSPSTPVATSRPVKNQPGRAPVPLQGPSRNQDQVPQRPAPTSPTSPISPSTTVASPTSPKSWLSSCQGDEDPVHGKYNCLAPCAGEAVKPSAPDPVPLRAIRDPMLMLEAPKPEPVMRMPLVWDTGQGEQTVYASSKPLGIRFNCVLPIKITHDNDGHGKDIGVKAGWILKSINFVDLTRYTSFQEVDVIFREQIRKLPRSNRNANARASSPSPWAQ